MTTATTKTSKTNGLGLRKDLKKVIPATPKAVEKKIGTEKKEEVKKTSSIETPAPVPELSLEQKIEKVENLKILIEKREILEESRKKLNAFVIGSPNFGENIKLTDEEGNTFQTSNTEVFTKVVATIKETLIEKIKEIETEIKF
jgi:hypothetical protein